MMNCGDKNRFKNWKLQIEERNDKSIKGSIDILIVDLMKLINARDEYCTTSSCSGRICVLSDELPQPSDAVKSKKCSFYIVSHEPLLVCDMLGVLNNISCSTKLKFEGFVMHVRCLSLTDAQKMLAAAIAAGFRNSGITLGKKCQNIIVAVRGTLCLEVPLTNNRGEMLVDANYVSHIVNLANEKLKENSRRINVFEKNLEKLFAAPAVIHLKTKQMKWGRSLSSSNSSVSNQEVLNDLECGVCSLFDDGN